MRHRRSVILILGIVALATSLEPLVASPATSRRRAVRHPGGGAVPVAAPDSYSVDQGSTLTVEAPGVLANDTLNGATLASFGPLTGAEQPTLGTTLLTSNGATLSLSAAGGFTYTPSGNFNGTDSFLYVIRNASGSSPASVAINVRAVQISAVADSYTTPPDTSLSVPAPGVLTNDTLAGGAIVSFGRNGTEETSLTATADTSRNGTISLRQDGSFLYTPPPRVDDGYGGGQPFTGVDTFRYVIRSGSVSSTGVVQISVQIPSAGADFVVTTPGHYYAISGLTGENPVLELKRGTTYTFQINASAVHPFAILDAPTGSVTNNNITEGRLTFVVPAAAASYRYRCTTHGFGNIINTVP